MHFASDNTGPVHPKVMAALMAANEGYAPGYGADALMGEVKARIRALFEAPEAEVFLVATGTAANVLSLGTLTPPYATVFCSSTAHIHEDECNAPEFYTSGAKLTLVQAPDGRMSPEALRASIEGEENRGVHGPKRGPVSITNVTERGTVYSVAEIAALTAIAKEYGLATHLDGARFANALVTTNASPAEMTWKAGVDVLSFGGTKNGLMGVEAVVFFDPALAESFAYRRKRGAHLFSKHRFLSAQMAAYLEDGLWLELARAANAANTKLVAGMQSVPGARYLYPPQANMGFVAWPRASHQRLIEAGAQYNIMSGSLAGEDPNEALMARLVCDWSASDADIERFVEIAKG